MSWAATGTGASANEDSELKIEQTFCRTFCHCPAGSIVAAIPRFSDPNTNPTERNPTMNSYAETTLRALAAQTRRTPYEVQTLLALIAQRDAEYVSDGRKYVLANGGEPATEAELAYLARLCRNCPPIPVDRPPDPADFNDWEARCPRADHL